jgi:hypothetical protein
MPTVPGDQQLELHGPPAAVPRVPFRVRDQLPADAGAALFGGRYEHPELTLIGAYIVHSDAAHQILAAMGHSDLTGGH